MELKNRSFDYRVLACILSLIFLICMPAATHSFNRGDCYLPPDGGDCSNRLSLKVKYFFDENIDECSEFIYFGCGGNGNRFDTFEECENSCLFNYGF